MLLFTAMIAVLVFPLPAPAQTAADFIRIQRDKDGQPLSLDTSIMRFEGVSESNGKPITVDLVSAVHIGDARYYQALNDRFKQYDSMLYELIAPKDHDFTARAESPSSLSRMQQGITNILGLGFQLDLVDYQAKNFVHADLSPDEFAQSMKDRGESLSKILLKLLTSPQMLEHSQKSEASQIVLLFTLFQKNSPQRQMRLRRLLATELNEVERFTEVLNGEEGSTILTARNDRALEVLREQILLERSRLAIFYGGAHMPDLAAKLRSEFTLVPTTTEWLVAWPITSTTSQE
jgi:hypothetical protein